MGECYHIKNLDKDCVFIGAELLAIKVGLAYLVEKLNEKLQEKGVNQKIEENICHFHVLIP